MYLRTPVTFLLSCLLLGAVMEIHGQSRPLDRAERTRREALPQQQNRDAPVRDDREAEESSEDDTPLGVDVKSIHLIAHQDDATMDPRAGPDSIVVEEELPAPEGLRELLEPFVGKPMSMALLSEVGKTVVLAWRESDYPLVDVYYPEQNITGGKLQVVVREAILGEKSTEGAVVSREEYLLRNLRLGAGDRINRRVVEADLDWLNQNPIRNVNLIYDRGDEDGTSDIVLDVTQEKAFSVYSGFANTGVNQTGEEEWAFGFNWNNPLRREHLIGYHFATDLEWDNLQAHSVFYQVFLPWRHTLQIMGAHVTSESLVAVPSITGLSEQLSADYRIPLPRPEFNRQWTHSFIFGFDYKSTNTDLLFGGLTFFGTEIEIGQFRAMYDAEIVDSLGLTRFSIGLAGSPGGMFENNDDISFDLARMNSTADYWYGLAEYERLIRLPQDFSLRFDLRAQSTGDRLASTEQLLAGGYATVRGFDESLVRGDSGFLSRVELISPDFSLCSACDDTWNAFVFYDAAALDISDALPGEVSPSLQSLGIGLNLRITDRGYARAAYGWGIQDHGLLPTDDDGGKFHFGVTLTY